MAKRAERKNSSRAAEAILRVFLGIVACAFQLTSAESDTGKSRSTGLSVSFHDGTQERAIEARIEYFGEKEDFLGARGSLPLEGGDWRFDDDEESNYERKDIPWRDTRWGMTAIGPFARIGSPDEIEFKWGGGWANREGVYFNRKRIHDMHPVFEENGRSSIRFDVCFSTDQKRLHLWVWEEIYNGQFETTRISVIYFDRRLREIRWELNPENDFKHPFCVDYETQQAAASIELHWEELFGLCDYGQSKDPSEIGAMIPRTEDWRIVDVVQRINHSWKRSGFRKDSSLFYYGMGQHEFLEAYLEGDPDGNTSPDRQIVFVRRVGSDTWFCVVNSENHRYGAFGTGWARKLELVDGDILRMFSTADWVGSAYVGDEGYIEEIDLNVPERRETQVRWEDLDGSIRGGDIRALPESVWHSIRR